MTNKQTIDGVSGLRALLAEIYNHHGTTTDHRDRICALLMETPAAQPQGEVEPVAYLDIGAGGYVDMGSDLSNEQLKDLPPGRHQLIIYEACDFSAAQPQGETGNSQAFEKFWYSEKTTAIGSTEAQKYFDAGAKHGRKGLPANPQGEVERLQLIEQAGQHVEDHLSKQIDIAEITIQGLREKLAERDALLREIANKCNVGFDMRERLLSVLSASAEPTKQEAWALQVEKDLGIERLPAEPKPRGEPVAHLSLCLKGPNKGDYIVVNELGASGNDIWSPDIPVYTDPPSHSGGANEMVAKVVLPNLKVEPSEDDADSDKFDLGWVHDRAMAFGYNEAINDVAKLNGMACTSCDGSGEYTDAIGCWRGYCNCPAGIEVKDLKGENP